MTDKNIEELKTISNECWRILREGLLAGTKRETDEYWENLLAAANTLIEKYKTSEHAEYARKYMLLVLTEIESDWKRTRRAK